MMCRKAGNLASTGCVGVLFEVLQEIDDMGKQNTDIQRDVEMMEAKQGYSEEEIAVFEEMKLLQVSEWIGG